MQIRIINVKKINGSYIYILSSYLKVARNYDIFVIRACNTIRIFNEKLRFSLIDYQKQFKDFVVFQSSLRCMYNCHRDIHLYSPSILLLFSPEGFSSVISSLLYLHLRLQTKEKKANKKLWFVKVHLTAR